MMYEYLTIFVKSVVVGKLEETEPLRDMRE
jgi:hypothetical protein